jgi:hypothetical protein
MNIVENDRSQSELLAEEECFRLLAGATLGRIAAHVRALPTVVPVAFVLTRRGIVISTVRDSWFDFAVLDTVVAFEADDVDPVDGSRWSVVVVGVAAEALDLAPEERRHIEAELGAAAQARTARLVRISFGMVSGHRIPVAAALV